MCASCCDASTQNKKGKVTVLHDLHHVKLQQSNISSNGRRWGPWGTIACDAADASSRR